MSAGQIKQVMGPVVDVEFSGDMPPIYTALKVKGDGPVLEVAGHLGDNLCRTVAMDATEGLVRGREVISTGEMIQVPVGEKVLGRIINVVGEPVDSAGPVKTDQKRPIHRPTPTLEEQSTSTEVLVTGIKVIDLLAPLCKGRENRPFRRRRCGKNRDYYGADPKHRHGTRGVFRFCRRRGKDSRGKRSVFGNEGIRCY